STRSWASFYESGTRDEQILQQRLLRVQPVAGFLPDDRARVLEQIVADFFAAMRRQAVHEERIRARAVEQPLIDLVALEALEPARPFLLVPHRRPDVGHDQMCALHGFAR